HLSRKEFVGVGKVGAAPKLHGRMIRAEFAEENVECDSLCALLREFVNDTRINLTRPVEAEMESDRAIPHGVNAVFIDINETKIGCDWRRKLKRLASAHVGKDALEALQKLQLKQAQETNKKDDSQGNQTGNKFERLGFHDGR